MHRGVARPTPPSAPVTTGAALLPAWATARAVAPSAATVGASPASWERGRHHPPAPELGARGVSYVPLSGAPPPAGARHSEMTANLLTGKGPNFRDFSERALIDHANQSDLQSAPFATRDTPPSRRVPNLDFSNISVHRGRESEKDVVLQQFL
jgi:hypothetical protein